MSRWLDDSVKVGDLLYFKDNEYGDGSRRFCLVLKTYLHRSVYMSESEILGRLVLVVLGDLYGSKGEATVFSMDFELYKDVLYYASSL